MFSIEVDSPARRLTFLGRAISLLVLIPGSIALGGTLTLSLVGGVLAVLAPRERVGLWLYLRSILTFSTPFIVVVGLIFFVSPVSVPIEESLIAAARAMLIVASGISFVMVTNPQEIPQGMVKIGMPQSFGVALMVAYRILPLLNERMRSILASQRARGLSWEASSLLRRLPSIARALAVPAVYSALDVALTLSDTLYVRGYRPDRVITMPEAGSRLSVFDVCVMIACFMIVLISIFD
ncbi:MAG TPA: energy-coupling factor transporter transmembrane component T [Thermoanaerobaculia bacterium]|nr:energy-coupling factor transporter transmembrane component T [Thermoanaerobaculia bacterium]